MIFAVLACFAVMNANRATLRKPYYSPDLRGPSAMDAGPVAGDHSCASGAGKSTEFLHLANIRPVFPVILPVQIRPIAMR